MLLGATFPLMSAGLVRARPTTSGESVSMLYFTNSLGAAAGVLASGFLLIGWVGGLILNAMPCVLPILSLKVFGIVQSASRGRRVLTVATLSTAAGILASFLGLAVAAIVARGAGSSVGWGVQFQEPRFVAFLAIAVLLFCLNLWGLFEIQLPAFLRRRIDHTAADRADRPSGHFVSGLFATLMATPCSAPFLGTAVGFALTQPPATVLAMFLAIGLGMASPYLLLAAFPRLAKRFPRPGEWMETLKGAMGFLLAGAVVWLFFVLSAQISAERLAFFQMAALAVALLLWLATRLRREAAQSLLRLLALALAIVSVPLVGRGGAAPRALDAELGVVEEERRGFATGAFRGCQLGLAGAQGGTGGFCQPQRLGKRQRAYACGGLRTRGCGRGSQHEGQRQEWESHRIILLVSRQKRFGAMWRCRRSVRERNHHHAAAESRGRGGMSSIRALGAGRNVGVVTR